jgi:mycothiol synthase
MAVETSQVGDVTFQEVDITSLPDAEYGLLNTFDNILQAEVRPEDPPTPAELTRERNRNIPRFVVVRECWASDPDVSIAATAYTWYRQAEENRHLLWTEILVRPDRRGRGIGRALLGFVADVADAEERLLITFGTSERVPAGEAFARRVGAEQGIAVHTNRLALADVDRQLMRRWIEDGPVRAPGYSLLALDGPYPDDLIDAIVDLHGVMNTAPRDNLDMEDMHFTVEQARESERSMLATGVERWSLFARRDSTGELAGFTEVYWNPKLPQTVWQGDTGVRPEHRGHALGKWLKAAMIERVLDERTDAINVRTGNADSNDAMLGINHAMGFKPYIAETGWQVRLEQVRAYLGTSR